MQPSTNLSIRISTITRAIILGENIACDTEILFSRWESVFKQWTFFLKPENIALKKVKKSNSPCPIIYSRQKSFSHKLAKNILILDETTVEQNANTSVIYHTGIDEITVLVLLQNHNNSPWCSWRIFISLPEKISVLLWWLCLSIWRWNYPRRFPFFNLPMLLRLNSTLLIARHLFYKQLFCFRVRN